MKNMSKITMICLLCFAASQVSTQTVVLINGVPTEVSLDGSTITKVKGEAKGYMSGFEAPPSNDGFQYAELRQESQAVVEEEKPVASPKIVTKSRTSDSPIVSGNYFKFKDDSALLSPLAMNEIKDHAKKIKAGKASTVLLESFHRANSSTSKELIKNRLDACKKYFEINGVPSNTIITNMYPNDKQSDKVSVTLR